MNKFWKNFNNSGLTLVELLVAVSIFAIVALAATSIFIKVMNVQKKAFAIQEVQDNISYAMGMISKEIRMMSEITTKDTVSTTLNFKNSKEEDVVYNLSNGQLLRNGKPITSSKVTVEELKFYVNDWDITNGPQPRITINMVMKISDSNLGGTKMRLQTTLTGRIYE